MRPDLILRINNNVENHNPYFVQKYDASGQLGLSSIQNVTITLPILVYVFSANHCDEYLKIGETTTIKSLKQFCLAVILLYKAKYLRAPIDQDIIRLLEESDSREFPGMLDSFDCIHWRGIHKGRSQKPTLILEAMVSRDFWI